MKVEEKKLEDYGTEFLRKLLSHVITNKNFFKSIYDVLSPDYFPHNAHKWVIDKLIEHYDKYKKLIPKELYRQKLIEDKWIVKQKDGKFKAIQEYASEVIKILEIEPEDFEEYRDTVVEVLKVNSGKKIIYEYSDKLNKSENLTKLRQQLQENEKIGIDRNTGLEYEIEFEERYKKNKREPIPTPWPQLNNLTLGGLGAGDLGIIYASPGGGKSWSLVAIGAHAYSQGKNVIYYTLELTEAYVGIRFDAYLTQTPFGQLVENSEAHLPKIKETVNKITSEKKSKLRIVEYPINSVSIETIKSHIQKVEDEGIKVDMILIDYLDLLKGDRKFTNTKDQIDSIYISTKNLAQELKIPIWSASQVNRSGEETDILTADKVAGSFDKNAKADLNISIQRKTEDEEYNQGTLHVMKNRYGAAKKTFSVNADLSMGRFILSDYMPNNVQISSADFTKMSAQLKSSTDTTANNDNLNDLPF